MPLNRENDAKLLVTLSMAQPKPFVCDDSMSAGIKWEIWLRQLDSYLDACGIKSEIQKIGILFNIAGEHVREVYMAAADKNENDEYKDVCKILTAHYKPKSNKLYQAFVFYEMRQSKQE